MIEWRLFPETTPKGLASYLVTYLDKENNKQVTVGCLVGNRWYYKHNNVMERIEGVVAFAKLPKPYKSEIKAIPIKSNVPVMFNGTLYNPTIEAIPIEWLERWSRLYLAPTKEYTDIIEDIIRDYREEQTDEDN